MRGSVPFSIMDTFRDRLFYSYFIIIQNIIQLIALILLFSKEANKWYNRKIVSVE